MLALCYVIVMTLDATGSRTITYRTLRGAFNQDVDPELRTLHWYNADDDAMHLSRAANTAYSDSFDTQLVVCLEVSMPNTLTGLVGLVLNGSNIEEQPSHLCIPAQTLAISQLLISNFNARHRETTTDPPSTATIGIHPSQCTRVCWCIRRHASVWDVCLVLPASWLPSKQDLPSQPSPVAYPGGFLFARKPPWPWFF